jgi:SAM-dependent methyltransferase
VNDTAYYTTPELYDAIYADIRGDIAPHVAAMRAAGGPALEVCCGNGRLLIPTLEAGVACDGLDRDRGMLGDLKRKLAARGFSAQLFEADMRTFVLPQHYALITIGFNSFLHNLTQEDQLATLRRCREHLASNGRLQIAIFHPSAERLIAFAERETLMKDIPHGEGRLRLWDRCEDDRVEQIRHVKRRVEMLDATGRVTEELHLEFTMRYIFKPEMELLLRVAGFGRWTVRPGSAADGATVTRAPVEGDVLLWTAWGAPA